MNTLFPGTAGVSPAARSFSRFALSAGETPAVPGRGILKLDTTLAFELEDCFSRNGLEFGRQSGVLRQLLQGRYNFRLAT